VYLALALILLPARLHLYLPVQMGILLISYDHLMVVWYTYMKNLIKKYLVIEIKMLVHLFVILHV
jgi:hypothetical protein